MARKLGLMMAFQLGSDQQAWLYGTIVLMGSLILHTVTRPYEDTTTDITEFLSLVTTLLIILTAPVFTFMSESLGISEESAVAQKFSQNLEKMTLAVILTSICVAIYAQAHVWRVVKTSGDDGIDYKELMIIKRLEKSKQLMDKLQKQQEFTHSEAEAQRRDAHQLARYQANLFRHGHQDDDKDDDSDDDDYKHFSNPIHPDSESSEDEEGVEPPTDNPSHT